MVLNNSSLSIIVIFKVCKINQFESHANLDTNVSWIWHISNKIQFNFQFLFSILHVLLFLKSGYNCKILKFESVMYIVCATANVAWQQSYNCKVAWKIWLIYKYFFLLRKWFIYRYFISHYVNEIMFKNLLIWYFVFNMK